MTLNSYWLQFIWVFFVALVSNYFFHKETSKINGIASEKWTWVQAGFLALPYVYWTAIRSTAFGDTVAYRNNVLNAPSTLADLPEYINGLTKDKGYYIFVAIFKCIFGEHVEVFFFIIAAIQMYAIVRLYRKYSNDYWLSMFIFIAITDYVSWMHNGVRQFLAATLIYLGTDWIIEKKYIRVLLLILFASLFHQSALLMIPFLLVITGRAWNVRTIIAIVVCALVVVYIARFTNFLDSVLETTQYTNVVSDWIEFKDDGANPIRALVYAIPAIIAVVGFRWVWNTTDPMINMCVNASILVAGLYLVAMFTSGIYIGRIPIYLSLYSNGILIPWEINMLFEEESAGFIKGLAVVLYSIFYYYQMHFTWGII